MASLRNILKDLKLELETTDKLRENAQEKIRRIGSLSKLAILFLHQKKMKDGINSIKQAKKILDELDKTAKQNPTIVYGGLFSAAIQEYSEANIFLKLIRDSDFASPKEIDVKPADYVLGLADVVGECRRSALDSLREGNLKNSEKYLGIMDEIYTELAALDEAYMLVPGLRRKCDVARKIIEATRGDVTQETRRSVLENQLKRLESRMKCIRTNPR